MHTHLTYTFYQVIHRIIIGFLLTLSIGSGIANALLSSPSASSDVFPSSHLPISGLVFSPAAHAQQNVHPLLGIFSEEKDLEDRDGKKGGNSGDLPILNLLGMNVAPAAIYAIRAFPAVPLPNFLRFCSLRL